MLHMGHTMGGQRGIFDMRQGLDSSDEPHDGSNVVFEVKRDSSSVSKQVSGAREFVRDAEKVRDVDG